MDPSENLSSFFGLLQYANILTDGLLGVGLLFIVGMVSFMSSKSESYERAMAYSMFFTTIIGFLFRLINLIIHATVHS